MLEEYRVNHASVTDTSTIVFVHKSLDVNFDVYIILIFCSYIITCIPVATNIQSSKREHQLLCLCVVKVGEEDLRSLMFGDYMNPDLEPDERVYEEIQELEAFYTVAEQCLEEYNNTHKTRMNLVIFR